MWHVAWCSCAAWVLVCDVWHGVQFILNFVVLCCVVLCCVVLCCVVLCCVVLCCVVLCCVALRCVVLCCAFCVSLPQASDRHDPRLGRG
jgi:hypothetical protein